ncbi:MAG: RluA family pseudouridine synthase [Eubacteriales bacterium]|nr:RluA family pseudouridine synthase [Eubacteriales bacterium]
MKEVIISNLEAGQRFDRFLDKYLSGAGKGFIYKMLRKKNITLNNKKADGSEKIREGDLVKIFFSDETFEKFTSAPSLKNQKSEHESDYKKLGNTKLDIVYEDTDMIFINKPQGMLSQKAKQEDISLVEYLNAYLLQTGAIKQQDLKTFRPGVCNRLDRNTSGIVAAGKTIKGLQELSLYFKDRSIDKYYICLVKGYGLKRQRINGFLLKDEKTNKVEIFNKNINIIPDAALPIETEYIPVADNGEISLVKVHLLTGRSHQIRAHMASIGFPLIGDSKYGDKSFNGDFLKKYHIKSQMLHAYELNIPQKDIHIHTKLPSGFIHVLKGENIWEPGIPEALEVLH